MTFRWSRAIWVGLIVAVVALASFGGLGVQALNVAVFGAIVVGIISRLWGVYRRDVVIALSKETRNDQAHRRQLINRLVFGAVWFTVAWSGLSVLGFFGPETAGPAKLVFGAALALWLGLALTPRRRVDIAHNAGLALGTLGITVAWGLALLPSSEPVEMALPVQAPIAIIQGGPTPLTNHHFLVSSQRDALDIVVLQGGLAVADDGPERFDGVVGFGEPLVAPVRGTVVTVVDGISDDGMLADRDHEHDASAAGNHVVIDMEDGHYVLLAHLKQDSVQVSVGDTVRVGDRLGELGNSGNSTMPHLHLQVMDGPELTSDVHTSPIVFVDAEQQVDDGWALVTSFLRRGDVVRPTGLAGVAAL